MVVGCNDSRGGGEVRCDDSGGIVPSFMPSFPPPFMSFPPSPVPSLIHFAWALIGVVALVHPCIYTSLAALYPSFPPHSHPCTPSFPPLFRPRLCPPWHLCSALFGPWFPPRWHLFRTLIPASLAPSFGPASRLRSRSFIMSLAYFDSRVLVRSGMHSVVLAMTQLRWPSLDRSGPGPLRLTHARLDWPSLVHWHACSWSHSLVVNRPRSFLLAPL